MTTAIIASPGLPAQPTAGLADEIDRQEREDNERGPERDETDTLLLDLDLDLELALLLAATGEDRPPLPTRPPNPGRHDRPTTSQPTPGRPHPQLNTQQGGTR